MELNHTTVHSPTTDDPSRIARVLETKILLITALSCGTLGFEDLCEELAVHFSVDVNISEKFISWLRRWSDERAQIALMILGMDQSDDDGPVHDRIGNIEIVPDPFVGAVDAQVEPNRRRKISMAISDKRRHVEIHTPVSQSQSKVPREQTSSGVGKQETRTPRKTSTDSTIVLATPPKNFRDSRSSTPGCSQIVQSLSLDDVC